MSKIEKDILYKYEGKSEEDGEIAAQEIFNKFLSKYNIKYDFDKTTTCYRVGILNLLEDIVYPRKMIKEFYDIADTYNYNHLSELQTLIYRIQSNIPNSQKWGYIKKYLEGSNFIKNASIDPNTDSIYLQTIYGEFKIDKFSNYNNKFYNYLMKNGRNYGISNERGEVQFETHCYANTYALALEYPEGKSYVSQCSDNLSNFLHAYCVLDNKVIDLTNNLVMDKDMFDKLYSTKELMSIDNNEVKNNLNFGKNEFSSPYVIERIFFNNEINNKSHEHGH